jgi:hypothetical protein
MASLREKVDVEVKRFVSMQETKGGASKSQDAQSRAKGQGPKV